MDPITGAALIGGAASILGGAMSDRSGRRAADRANSFTAGQAALDRGMQYDFARNGLRYRVEDARRAGLHPLAAVGAQLNPFTPSGQSGQFYSGSAMGDGVRAAGAMIAEAVARRDKEKAETRLLNAQADFVTQQAADSQAARITQGAQIDVATPGFKEVQQQRTTPEITTVAGTVKTAKTADAQTFEDRYGELGGAILGLSNIPADLAATVVDFLKVRGRQATKRPGRDLPPVLRKRMYGGN